MDERHSHNPDMLGISILLVLVLGQDKCEGLDQEDVWCKIFAKYKMLLAQRVKTVTLLPNSQGRQEGEVV